MKLSIVIPVYKEISTLHRLIDRVLAVHLPDVAKQLVLVDDASTDGSQELLQGLADCPLAGAEFKVLLQPINAGKGRHWPGLRRGGREDDPDPGCRSVILSGRLSTAIGAVAGWKGRCGLRLAFCRRRGSPGPVLLALAR